jgi:hypothetical protein
MAGWLAGQLRGCIWLMWRCRPCPPGWTVASSARPAIWPAPARRRALLLRFARLGARRAERALDPGGVVGFPTAE